MFLIIALNVIFAIVVVSSIVGLHAHAIRASHVEGSARRRRAHTRSQVARRRLVTG